MIQPHRKIGPLYTQSQFKDVKDPCIVYDGTLWHIYGSGGDVRSEVWQILHATSEHLEGPWTEQGVAMLDGVRGDHVAAPSVIYDTETRIFHMLVQTEFTSIGGTIEHLESTDGMHFKRMDTALESLPDTGEAGIYDPHHVSIGSEKYIVYAGTPAVEKGDGKYSIQPDIYLAKSTSGTWSGPWARLGKILDHDHIDWHHNHRLHTEYEWGIEGPQLLVLPSGKILMNATCFLSEGKFGTRQRVFFALADTVLGPYRSIGPVLVTDKDETWANGENGHAMAYIEHNQLYLFYQARSQQHDIASENNWRYGIAVYNIADIELAHKEQRSV